MPGSAHFAVIGSFSGCDGTGQETAELHSPSAVSSDVAVAGVVVVAAAGAVVAGIGVDGVVGSVLADTVAVAHVAGTVVAVAVVAGVAAVVDIVALHCIAAAAVAGHIAAVYMVSVAGRQPDLGLEHVLAMTLTFPDLHSHDLAGSQGDLDPGILVDLDPDSQDGNHGSQAGSGQVATGYDLPRKPSSETSMYN